MVTKGLEDIASRKNVRICVRDWSFAPNAGTGSACATVIHATALKSAECLSDPGLGRDRERMTIYVLLFCCRSSSRFTFCHTSTMHSLVVCVDA